jgi:hypothetical protein
MKDEGEREKGKRKVGVFLERGKPPLTPNFSREGKRERIKYSVVSLLHTSHFLLHPLYFILHDGFDATAMHG